MPKVLSSPKLPPNRGSGRRNFRLSPLEIGVAILVAMGGIYLLYVLLSGLWGGGEAPTPGPGSLAGINPARLDKVLSAAEVAQRRLSELDKRLVELDKRLAQASSGAPAEAGKGDPRLAARLSALEKQVAALAKAPGGKGGKADPKLAAKIQGLEAGFKELDQEKEQLAAQVQKMAKSKADPKLAAKVQGLEKQVAALAKAKPAAPDAKAQKRLAGLEKQVAALAKAKPSAPDAKTQKRLSELEKQVLTLAQRPAAKGEGGAAVNPQLVQRVVGQGQVLSGVTSTLGKMRRDQQRRDQKLDQRLAGMEKRLAASPADDKRLAALEKQVAALSAAKPGAKPAGPSPDEAKLSRKVAELEKELARVRKDAAAARQADPKLAARLATLEKKQAGDDRQEKSLDRRLDNLEKQVASRPAPRPAATKAKAKRPAVPQMVRIVHTVRPGQTLYGLARTYGTNLAQIKAWNPKLAKRNKILIGEKLVIYVRK